MSASVPVAESSSGQAAPATGGWGGASTGGSWGTASTETSDKRDCDVQYIGGSASRARRAVQA
jgi:hypothetical protein